MNIALVDDMPKEIIRLSEIIEEYATEHQLPVELQTFDSAEALLTSYHPLQYTLIFMDIYMDSMTGVEAAKKIRESDKETLIVFLTTSKDHTFDALKVHAYQYILKVPEKETLQADVWRVLDDVVALRSLSEAGITVVIGGNEQTFLTRMTFSGIHSLLEQDSRFLQINRGIIINMDFIDTFESDTCVLHGGFRLPISVREQKKLDQIRRNYVFTKLHNKKRNGGGSR